jgi:hypothetical protein
MLVCRVMRVRVPSETRALVRRYQTQVIVPLFQIAESPTTRTVEVIERVGDTLFEFVSRLTMTRAISDYCRSRTTKISATRFYLNTIKYLVFPIIRDI